MTHPLSALAHPTTLFDQCLKIIFERVTKYLCSATNMLLLFTRLILLILTCIPREVAQTLPANGNSIQKRKGLTVWLEIKLENKTFLIFHMGIVDI